MFTWLSKQLTKNKKNNSMKEILSTLESVESERSKYPTHLGICHICRDIHENKNILPEEIENFLDYSFNKLGLDRNYPVVHPLYYNNQLAYLKCYDLWADKYGENRKYLLNLLIKMAKGKVLTPADVNWPHPRHEIRRAL